MSIQSQPAVYLKPGREKSVLSRHPWIFSGAVKKVAGDPQPGQTVEIFASDGDWLCRGAYSPQSNIRIRVWTWNADQPVAPLIESNLRQAISMRSELQLGETEMLRLVNAESDGLPGLIVDRYRNVIVVQFLSTGVEAHREQIVHFLSKIDGIDCVYERSDLDVRQLEGLRFRSGLLWGELPSQPMICTESGYAFKVDLIGGHKTGFYLDQRRNRRIFAQMVSEKQVLNCFSYTGAFSVYGLAGGASSVTSVESSNEAMQLAEENILLNGFSKGLHEGVEGDVFQILRLFRDQDRAFDAVILDPPKFAPTTAHAQRAARGYKDINLLAFKLLKPGGYLFTFSCSGGVSMDLFQKIVSSAALDAGVQATILLKLYQDQDHPVRLNFPEGAYLKGLVCRLAE